MTKGERLEQYKAKRQKIKSDINVMKRKPDSVEKYQRLIKLANDYQKVTMDMNLDGINAKVHPASLSVQYWKEAYDAFLAGHPKKLQKCATEPQLSPYNIILCWTVKPDYCVCDSIIKTIQNYLTTIGVNIKHTDLTKSDFPDRIEFCETYTFECTKDQFDLILKSAEYILDISAGSMYDRCNVGIFGKSL